jgi:ATP-binding cassette subfamily B (MDR/TAP) protein 1
VNTISQHHSSASIVFWSPTEGFCWARTAERQTFRLRRQYLQAVLRQDVGFFDTNQGASLASQVVSNISIDTLTIQGFLAEKVLFLSSFNMSLRFFLLGFL